MNRVLLHRDELSETGAVVLSAPDRRYRHIRGVIRPDVGETVSVGLIGGKLGEGTVVTLDDDTIVMTVELDGDPPAPLPVILLVALPRPKSLFKTLQLASTMGVKDLHFFNASRVDKSFWQSRRLSSESVDEHLLIGLEQAGDTVVPTVSFHRLFGPFVKDELPSLVEGRRRFVAHPGSDAAPCPHAIAQPSVVALGPERGFIDHEVRCFRDLGFELVHLGDRVLRLEQAVAVVLAKMFD